MPKHIYSAEREPEELPDNARRSHIYSPRRLKEEEEKEKKNETNDEKERESS